MNILSIFVHDWHAKKDVKFKSLKIIELLENKLSGMFAQLDNAFLFA